jgi:hypothetical protein
MPLPGVLHEVAAGIIIEEDVIFCLSDDSTFQADRFVKFLSFEHFGLYVHLKAS